MRLLILLLTLAVLAEPAAAQPFIRVRDFVAGDLAAGDSVQTDGSRYDTYRFRAEPGRVYYLYLFAEFEGWLDVGSRPGPRCGAACVRAEEDGEAGSTVATQFIPERPGTYLVRAGGMRGEAGRYRLTLESQEVAEEVADSLWPGADTLGLPVDSLPDPEIYAGTDTLPLLFSGEPRKGVLRATRLNDRGEPYDGWVYYGSAEETITVTMESDAFDTVLRIRTRGFFGGGEELAWDDDGGGGTNSAVTVQLPVNGAYLIEAAGFDEDARGGYTLLLTSDGAGATTDTVFTPASPADTVVTTTATMDTMPLFSQAAAREETVQVPAAPIRAGLVAAYPSLLSFLVPGSLPDRIGGTDCHLLR